MKSNEVRDWSIAGVCICTMFILIGVGSYAVGWCRGVSHLLEQAQNTADSVAQAAAKSNQASEEMFDASGIIVYQTLPRLNGLLDSINKGTLPKVNALLTTANGTLASTTTTIGAIGALGDAAKGKIEALDVTGDQKKALDALDDVLTLRPHVQQAVDNLAEAEDTVNTFLADPATAGARDDIAGLAASGSKFLAAGTTTLGHVDADFFAPYTGKHPKRHAAWKFAKGLMGVATTGAEGLYYGTNIK